MSHEAAENAAFYFPRFPESIILQVRNILIDGQLTWERASCFIQQNQLLKYLCVQGHKQCLDAT
jgi:hypothetical protein